MISNFKLIHYVLCFRVALPDVSPSFGSDFFVYRVPSLNRLSLLSRFAASHLKSCRSSSNGFFSVSFSKKGTFFLWRKRDGACNPLPQPLAASRMRTRRLCTLSVVFQGSDVKALQSVVKSV